MQSWKPGQTLRHPNIVDFIGAVVKFPLQSEKQSEWYVGTMFEFWYVCLSFPFFVGSKQSMPICCKCLTDDWMMEQRGGAAEQVAAHTKGQIFSLRKVFYDVGLG